MKLLLLALLALLTPAALAQGPPDDLCPQGCCALPEEPLWDAEPSTAVCGGSTFIDPVAYVACLVTFQIEEVSAELTAHGDWQTLELQWGMIVSDLEAAYDAEVATKTTDVEKWEVYATYGRALCDEHGIYDAAAQATAATYDATMAREQFVFLLCVANNACRNYTDWPCHDSCKPVIPPALAGGCLLAAALCGDGSTPDIQCMQDAYDGWYSIYESQFDTWSIAYAERVVDFMLLIGYWVSEYEAGNIDCAQLCSESNALNYILIGDFDNYQDLIDAACSAAQQGYQAEVLATCCD